MSIWNSNIIKACLGNEHHSFDSGTSENMQMKGLPFLNNFLPEFLLSSEEQIFFSIHAKVMFGEYFFSLVISAALRENVPLPLI